MSGRRAEASRNDERILDSARVVFVDDAVRSVPLEEIQAISVGPESVLLETASGPGPFLIMDEHLELAALILSRVLS
jgi:hypothetical protein